ncbi:selenium-dependent molybdenum cofactor biosynthesis protein YqeB [Chloroflexota bacterium]
MSKKLTELTVLIKGGGEVASGVAHRLYRAHFKICLTEAPNPQAVSRGVSFSEAVYDGEKEVEGVVAKLVKSFSDIPTVWGENKIPIIVDPEAAIKDTLHPSILIDAIMAKRNLGTRLTDADLVIGLGPGFQAGKDVHLIVETNNSERLGEVIFAGEAEKNTGVPIAIDGLTSERVLHSTDDGLFVTEREIGERVTAGEVIASVGRHAFKAPIGGVVRALLRSGIQVKEGTKLAEIDQVASKEICYSIRARVRAIAGGVLEAILIRFNA